ncbi:MAG: chorismate-binding protein, partial [Bacilli bacterium]
LGPRLHPTPAVAGSPKRTALQIIREREHMDRGWYAGPLGWIEGEGDGMFVVTLRSALLDERGADLFAGAGIVEGSEPLDEWRETEWKMRPMRVALGQELMR